MSTNIKQIIGDYIIMARSYEYLENRTFDTTLYTDLRLKLAVAEKDIGLTIVAAHDRPKTDALVEFKKDENIICLDGPSSKRWDACGKAYKEAYPKLFDILVAEIKAGKLTTDPEKYIWGDHSIDDGTDLECPFN